MDRQTFEKNFASFWRDLLGGRSHLDSVLSRATPAMKGLLAQIGPRILRQPASYAQEVGIGLNPGEPWSLRGNPTIAEWPTASRIAADLYESKWIEPRPVAEDFPPEMIEAWSRDFGAEVAEKLVQVLGQSAPMSLRVARKADPLAVLKLLGEAAQADHWRDSGFASDPRLSALAPHAIVFDAYAPVLNTAPREEGLFEIQDEGSQLLALIALWPNLVDPLLGTSPGTVKWKTALPA
ncbi:MAG: hypothetical protein AAB425_07925, partial [Bdellovibrionota bacterium]